MRAIKLNSRVFKSFNGTNELPVANRRDTIGELRGNCCFLAIVVIVLANGGVESGGT